MSNKNDNEVDVTPSSGAHEPKVRTPTRHNGGQNRHGRRQDTSKNNRFGASGLLSAASAPSIRSITNKENDTESSMRSMHLTDLSQQSSSPPRPTVPIVPAPIDLRQLRESAVSFRSHFGGTGVTGHHFGSDRSHMYFVWDDDSTDDRIVVRAPGVDFAHLPTMSEVIRLAKQRLSSREELQALFEQNLSSTFDLATVGEEIDYNILDEKDLKEYFRNCSSAGKCIQLRLRMSSSVNDESTADRSALRVRGKVSRKRARRIQTLTGSTEARTSSEGTAESGDTNTLTNQNKAQFQAGGRKIPCIPAGLPPGLIPIFNDKTESLAELEATLQHFKVDASAWKASFGVKTVQNLYEEVCQGTSSLYADTNGVVRVVNLVRVKISCPEKQSYLVECKKYQAGDSRSMNINKLLARKFSLDDGPFLAAMHAIQQELGSSLWGPIREHVLSDSKGGKKIKTWVECMMSHVHPLAFEKKSYEESGSNSYPGLRSWYLIDTLLVDFVGSDAPLSDSFVTKDAVNSSISHVWQWIPTDIVNRDIVNSGPKRRSTCGRDALGQAFGATWESAISRKQAGSVMTENTMEDKSCSLVTRVARNIKGKMKEGKNNVQVRMRHIDDSAPTPEEYPVHFRAHLETWLRGYGVPVELWGKGATKSLDDLITEILKNETELQLVNGQAVRTVRVAKVTVQNSLEKSKLLVETHQSIVNVNKPDKKNFKIRHLLLSEKFSPKELPWHAAKRGICEELLECETVIEQLPSSNIGVAASSRTHQVKRVRSDSSLAVSVNHQEVKEESQSETTREGKSDQPPEPNVRIDLSEQRPRHVGNSKRRGESPVRKFIINNHKQAMNKANGVTPPAGFNGPGGTRELEKRIHLVDMIPPKIEDEYSPSYPGLLTRYELHNFVVEVDGLHNGDFATKEVKKKVNGRPVEFTFHHWKWHTREEYRTIESSLILKVRDYFKLIEAVHDKNVQGYNQVLEKFVFTAAEKNDIEVIKYLTAERQPDYVANSSSLSSAGTTVTPTPAKVDGSNEFNTETSKPVKRKDNSTNDFTGDEKPLPPLLSIRQVVDRRTSNSPLRQAALSNAADAVETLVILLLTRGRAVPLCQLLDEEEEFDDVNQRDDFGCTLIYYAAMVDHAPLVEALLSMEKVAANSVCLQSCIQRRATNVLALLLPRLRHLSGQPSLGITLQEEDRLRPLQRFGPNQLPTDEYESPRHGIHALASRDHFRKLQKEGKSYSSYLQSDDENNNKQQSEAAESNRGGNGLPVNSELTVGPSHPDYFEYLLSDALKTLYEDRGSGAVGAKNSAAVSQDILDKQIREKKRKKRKSGNGDEPYSDSLRVYHITRNRLEVVARTLEVVLQNSNPTWPFYRKYLAEYLHAVVEQDSFEVESAIISQFIQESDFPLHVAMTSAHVMREARNLAPRFYEAYHKHEVVLQDMINNILDCCMDQQEAEHLLRERADLYTHGAATAKDYWESEGNMSDLQKYKSTCSYLAVKYQLKDVVAHKYFTTQNDEVWFSSQDSLYVRWVGWSNRNTGKRMWIIRTLYRICVTVFLLFLLAILIPLLWVLPFSSSLRHTVDLSRTEFNSCYFRWSSWSISYVCFLAALAYSAFEPASENPELYLGNVVTWGELVLGVFILGYVVSLIEQVGMMEFSAFVSHPVNLVDSFSLLCFSVAYILLLCGSRVTYKESYDVLMSLGSLSAVFRLFHLFSASKSLGPLWVAIQFVWWDVVRFACLLSVFIFAFMLALVFLLRDGQVKGFTTASQTFTSLMWSIYEPYSSYDDPASQPYQNLLYQVFLFTFLLFAAVLLTNLLIAMMTDRYNAVHQTARKEWRFSLAQLIDRYSNMPIVPAPMNLLLLVPNLVFRLFWPREPLYDPLDSNLLAESFDAQRQMVTEPHRRYGGGGGSEQPPPSEVRKKFVGIGRSGIAARRMMKAKVYASNLAVETAPTRDRFNGGDEQSGAPKSARLPETSVSPYRSSRGVLSKTSFARSYGAAKSFFKSQLMGSPTNRRGGTGNSLIIRTASSFRNRGKIMRDQSHIDYSSRELTLGLAHKRHSVFNNLRYRSTRNLVMERFRNRCELAEDRKNELGRAIRQLGLDISTVRSRLGKMNKTMNTVSSDSQVIGRTLEALVELGIVSSNTGLPNAMHQSFFMRSGSAQSNTLANLASPASSARDARNFDGAQPYLRFTQQSTRRFRDLHGCLPPDEHGEEPSTGRGSYTGSVSRTSMSNY